MSVTNCVAWLIGMLFAAFSANAADIYVGRSDGNKTADGSIESPYTSLEDAIRHARELRRLNDPGISEGINIWVKDGVYFS